ncbi:type 1 glutamine amidotransferase domain-containing protein [Neiella marina]|uniref:Type 1 glutamine amidotransferase domain-containing protein n=1 Tax=Neiella holothuriorum TaxID=2870530 RepID=A0ABS7EFK8_9GAMM|nr:type 1 glutamine amidotransferase domain-containing protein [Neiella holothuriorum]MBW8191127.1 type 1 glutamine amidotransferase domain-containing protein [Neiella holothuriorum]
MIRKILLALVILFGALYGAWVWLKGLVPAPSHFEALKRSQSNELSYLIEQVPEFRGKILAVVTSTDQMGQSGKSTGYELTELARAYWVFTANGFEVDIASPEGGKPPVVIDGDDMGAFDYAFLNDQVIQAQLDETMRLDEVTPLDYQAVYFVGGKGAMFDFPNNLVIQDLISTMYQNDRVVSAVCHGPAALVNVRLADGNWLVADKRVSAFTNEEELFLIPDAAQIFPFLLQDKLEQRGALVQAGAQYLEQISQDGKLITGQNPWSVWTMAEMVIAELGYEPKPRERTPEEHSVELLLTYDRLGYEAAHQEVLRKPQAYQRILILMHGVVAVMNWDLVKGFELLRLAQQIKQLMSA